MDIAIQLLASCIGTLGFGVLFNVRGKKLLWATIGGFLTWGLFLLLAPVFPSEPIRYFIVSMVSTVYAEVLARCLKTPACTFCIVTLVPLVPGGALYRTTTLALSGQVDRFLPQLIYTLELAVALSLGIVVITAATRFWNKLRQKNPVH